jgi:hypothetical protein
MKFTERSYTDGRFFRPKPVVIERPESHLLVVATPWGPVESAQKAAATIVDQFEILQKEDLTTPFEPMPTISVAANRLRIGALTANQYLFRTENARQWKVAVEMVALHYEHHVLSWTHIGGPHLLALEPATETRPILHPLAYEPDWALQSGNQGPLFSQALGLEANLPLRAGSIRLLPGAQLLLLGRSALPRQIYQVERFDSQNLIEAFVEDDVEAPFWMGLIELDEG